jgi:epoxide hydrolase-like predicted phosphatase
VIDAVLFDLHGVVTSSPWSALAAVGTGTGASEEEVLLVILGEYTTDGDHPWHRLERGEIGFAEYVPGVLALAEAAGITLDFSRLRGFSEQMQVNEAVVARIAALRDEGYKTGLVTNNVREFASGWRKLIDVEALFDVVVDSSDVGVRKPDPAIYLLALERLGVADPSRVVFLDDAPGNVAGAAAAGLRTILVADPEAALEDLNNLVGPPILS